MSLWISLLLIGCAGYAFWNIYNVWDNKKRVYGYILFLIVCVLSAALIFPVPESLVIGMAVGGIAPKVIPPALVRIRKMKWLERFGM